MSTADDDEADQRPADDEQPNAGTTAGVQRQRKSVKRDLERRTEFWRGVLGTPIGREVVWGLLADAHTFDTRFATGPNGSPQPEATWFHAGQQEFGQRLYQSLLVMDLNSIKRMHDEHDARFKAAAVASATKSEGGTDA